VAVQTTSRLQPSAPATLLLQPGCNPTHSPAQDQPSDEVGCRLVDLGADVTVDVAGDRDRRVAEALGDDLEGDARLEGRRRVAVPLMRNSA
jgi:hypothetical protein